LCIRLVFIKWQHVTNNTSQLSFGVNTGTISARLSCRYVYKGLPHGCAHTKPWRRSRICIPSLSYKVDRYRKPASQQYVHANGIRIVRAVHRDLCILNQLFAKKSYSFRPRNSATGTLKGFRPNAIPVF
jgi:hypothetical protein